MLKKAGILVAVAAAGVLAVAPLAFAGEKGGDHHGHDTYTKNVKNIKTTETSPSCTFANASDGSSRQDAAGVSSPLLGLLGTAANAAAPVTTQANAPIGSCNNFSDLVDLNSNNDTKTVDNSKTVTDTRNINKTSSDTSSFSSVFSLLGL